MKPPLEFRLRRDANTYYYVNGSNVLTSSTPKPLIGSCVDWKDLQLQYVRNSRYWGVFRKQAPEMIGFARDGAKILRYLFNTQGGIEATCYLEVMRLNTLSQQYAQLGLFSINFSKYRNTLNTVEVALMDGGLSAKLMSGEDTPIMLPVGDPDPDSPNYDSDASWLYMNGIQFEGQYNYETEAGGTSFLNMTNMGDTSFTSIVGTAFLSQEGEYGVAITNDVVCDATGTVQALSGVFQEKWTYGQIKPGFATLAFDDFRLTDIQWAPGNGQTSLLTICAQVFATPDFSTPLIPVEHVFWGSGFQPAGTFLTPGVIPMFPLTFNFPAGSYLVIYYRIEVMNPLAFLETNIVTVHLPDTPNQSHMRYVYIPPVTNCRALTHWGAFKKLYKSLAEAPAVDPISDILTTSGDHYDVNPIYTFLTPGDALRRLYYTPDLQYKDPEIAITPKDFAFDAFVSLCAGVGIERNGSGQEVLRLEHLSHFLQAGVLIKDLGSAITDFEMLPYTDHIGNDVTIGYENQEYEDVNGRFEYNSETIFKSAVVSDKNKLEYKSRIRHDCYGATFTRINLANKQTTDSQSDNETFKLQSDGVDLPTWFSGAVPFAYQLDRTEDIVAGLPASVNTTVFNIPFSPKRQILRMMPFIKANFYGLPNQTLTFVKSEKNVITSTSEAPGDIVENESVDISSTPETPLFKPYTFSFNAQVPLNLVELMETNPYGVFRFTYKGYVLEGFVMEAGINPATNNVFTFKLLCSPNTVIPAGL